MLILISCHQRIITTTNIYFRMEKIDETSETQNVNPLRQETSEMSKMPGTYNGWLIH